MQIEKKIFDFFDRKLCSENVCEQTMFQYGIKNVANVTKNVREQKMFASKICSKSNIEYFKINRKCSKIIFVPNRTKIVAEETQMFAIEIAS